MLLPVLAIAAGLAVLLWSAGLFVAGAAATARHFGMPPLLIGMVVVGFGTSAPELVVSALSAVQGNPGIALGNAYGSNITNIGLILGVTALLRPVAVHSAVLRRELPVLVAVTAVAAAQLVDGHLSRPDAAVLLVAFGLLLTWTVWEGRRGAGDALGTDVADELAEAALPLGRAATYLGAGLLLLMASSRALVWGAVAVATSLGVDDLVIGLTVVAAGTSLPELASSIIAARRGEHDLALGNVLGSNLFNTMAVVGLAGAIHPMAAGPEVLARDVSVMAAFTGSLFVLGYGFRGPGRINRLEGAALLAGYVGYTAYLVSTVLR